MDQKKLKNISHDFDYITEKSLPKTEYGLNSLKEECEKNGHFHMTLEEYIVYENLSNEHLQHLRDEVTGFSKFGTIGGGSSVWYHIENGKQTVKFRCDGCHNTYDISVEANKLDKIQADESFIKKYKNSSCSKMSLVEYLRYKKFCELYLKNGYSIDISFMSTGLGYLIYVKCEEAGVEVDITDTDCW